MNDIATARKTKTPKVKKPAIAKLEVGGDTYISVRDAPADVKQLVLNVLQPVLGWHEARAYDYVYPVDKMMVQRDSIIENFQNHGEEPEEKDSKFHPFVLILDEFVQTMRAQLAEKLKTGSVEFGDIPYLLVKGTEVSTISEGEAIGGTVESCQLFKTMMGVFYVVKISVISNTFGSVSNGSFKVIQRAFTGLKKVGDLAVHPIEEDVKTRLTTRGEAYRRYATGVHFIHYTGQLVKNSWFGPKSYRADGRAMLDVKSFQQVDSDQFRQEGYQGGVEEPDEERNNRVDMEIADDDLWRTYPYLYGFSLSAKQWGRLNVQGISEIAFREDAFDLLVLPQEDKKLIRAIVEDDSSDFSDLIDGKGGGSIFLLHGPPGQGKTLTAEAISEVLKRPLYSISVGELGTNPDSLEQTLREILDVATVWNAVLLLDEADIFLEERDEKDIVRNAMVGVFLRLLEYHQGVLFLTTNRVKNIDKAFYSRISIGLRFGVGDQAKRRQIWSNLTSAAKVSGLDLDALSQHDLNGRQIKNVIKLSIKLARADGVPVSEELIGNVILRTGNFSNEERKGDTQR